MNDSGAPRVSIGMAVLNCQATLAQAIQSILNQTFSDWELLVVDDGSSDETVRIARGYCDRRIRVFCDGSHRGLVARLNQAVDLSRGRYFARMDGDDVSYPQRLALQIEHLERHSEIALLGGAVMVLGRGGQILGTRECRTTHEHICRRPWGGLQLAHPTWMGQTEWFRKHPYRSEAVRCEDQDLLLRTYECSRFAALPEIVLGYREEMVSLKKILVGRFSFVCSFLRRAIPRRDYPLAVAAVVNQSLKGLIDIVAVSTGLSHKILRHRALPVDEAAKLRWLEVWEAVQTEHDEERRSSCADAGEPMTGGDPRRARSRTP
jgi:glycosyltransferase involved in cell wall biosynthesis